jgi:hypothetical protein
MIRSKHEIWIGLAGLTVALTGCPAEDEGNDTNNTTFTSTTAPSTTDGEETTDDQEETTDDPTDPSATEVTTDPPTTTDATTDDPTNDTSGDPVVCDPPCAGGEECLGGICVPTGDCDPPCAVGEECVAGECVGGPGSGSDYGPCAACAPGEMPVMVAPAVGCFCSPMCDGEGSMCPAPNDGTAQGMCVLELMMGAGPSQCALICDPAQQMCPAGATCEEVQAGVGVCTHPA